jgi:ferredoxin/flavodoxin---NADP+ reductase
MTLLARPLPAVARRRAALPATNATLVARRDVGASAALFELELDAALVDYRPGQYVALGLLVDGVVVQRPYSVASLGKGGRHLELFVRRVNDGALSPRLWLVDAGARLRIGPARGLFVLDRSDRRRRLFVGAGTGVAPLLAMLADCAGRLDATPVTLLHAVSFADELVFGHRLAAWGRAGLRLDYRPTVSRHADPRNAGWSGATGRAESQLRAVLDDGQFDPHGTVTYICGNPSMVEACVGVLVAAGVAPDDIHAERF